MKPTPNLAHEVLSPRSVSNNPHSCNTHVKLARNLHVTYEKYKGKAQSINLLLPIVLKFNYSAYFTIIRFLVRTCL